ncbi:hypothetical protein B9Z55_016225 [Caenorhabditis nigoni]|uniref:Uncharacterized protein n=1 Tax=Caenorhabditis nigoni TaxID=1611254 RepID=A0A2G5UDZ0_9PELO|nr:hypothetical protein B9Z55_016225 [Caenorhabditis nigoni]
MGKVKSSVQKKVFLDVVLSRPSVQVISRRDRERWTAKDDSKTFLITTSSDAILHLTSLVVLPSVDDLIERNFSWIVDLIFYHVD